jgi:lysophospholipase L1-like esterase
MCHGVVAFLILSLAFAAGACAAEPSAPREKIRIACIGDSVTFGDGLKQRDQAYPGQLQKSLGDGFDVRNFGVNSMAILKKADFSYFNNPAYQAALNFQPNIVVMQFGGNDSKTQNWVHKADFMKDARELIGSFRALATKPRIIINTTSPAFVHKWAITDECILDEVIPQLRQTAFNEGLEIIDIHTALLGKGDMFPDKMHPGPEACTYIAKVVESTLMFKDDPACNIEKALAEKKLAVKVSNFYGFRQLDFTLPDGVKATIVRPYRVAAGRPIAWRADQFGEQPQTDIALLQRGYHVVWVETPSGGDSTKNWDSAHTFFKGNGLTGKITLIAMGAAGLPGYFWASAHPEAFAVFYGDSAQLTRHQDLRPAHFAKAGIAIILVVGKKDVEVLPEGEINLTPSPSEIADQLEKSYKELGGTIEVIRKPDAGLKPYSLPNPEPIVQFILDHNQ